jgi:hypothetical protein
MMNATPLSPHKTCNFWGIKINYARLGLETMGSPKCKTFAWLIIQNRVWTADTREERVGKLLKMQALQSSTRICFSPPIQVSVHHSDVVKGQTMAWANQC